MPCRYAKQIGTRVIGGVGRDGGYTAQVADACVIVAEDGRAESYSAQTDPSEEWTTLTVRAQKVDHPAPGDNFSLGLFGMEVGDWFEVRELSLFVGTLP